jgi:hypothetical protein
MSQVTMTVVDAQRAVHGEPHGSFIDRVVAALSADPETIEELQAAVARFTEPDRGDDFAGWYRGLCDEPYDAGICLIDLAARVVVVESTYSQPGPTGSVFLHRSPDDECEVPYHLADEWLFLDHIDLWPGTADGRRRQRAAQPPLDARAVLYGPPLWAFLVDECLAARGGTCGENAWTPPAGWSLRVLPERAKQDQPLICGDAVAEIHARWLMTPRDDLRGQTPRELLVARRDHVSWDLQDRSEQWSMTRQCPPPLSCDSAAFRYGGFGTHENVLYYDMVRELAWHCWDRLVDPPDGPPPAEIDRAEEVAHLGKFQDEWMASPDHEDLCGHTPAALIEMERRRIPWAVSAHEAMVDDDCPLCQMAADSGRPAFWNLDGCNNDYDFPFSFYHRTREEYDEEERRHAEFSQQFEEERRRRKEAGLPDDEVLPWDDDGSTIWQRSFSRAEPDSPPSIMLFGIGSHLSELIEDLRSSEAFPAADTLNRQFGNLRDAMDDESGSLVDPVVARFCDELHSVGESHPDLEAKCADLQRQLHLLTARVSGEPPTDEDIPY